MASSIACRSSGSTRLGIGKGSVVSQPVCAEAGWITCGGRIDRSSASIAPAAPAKKPLACRPHLAKRKALMVLHRTTSPKKWCAVRKAASKAALDTSTKAPSSVAAVLGKRDGRGMDKRMVEGRRHGSGFNH